MDAKPDLTIVAAIEEPEDLQPEPEVPDAPPYHTMLEVWRAVLDPARHGPLRTEPITPQWATSIVATYAGVSFADTVAVRDQIHDMIDRLGAALDEEIASDPECLTRTTPELDATENAHHYRSLLRKWQTEFLIAELAWVPTDPYAAVQLAVLSEVHKMFFGDNSLTAHLETIKFQFTEDDQRELHQALLAVRAAALGGADE